MGESADPAQTKATPPPVITAMAMLGNQIRLAWTNSVANLYYTPSLTVPLAWALVTNAPVLSDSQWTVTLPTGTNGRGFYRLQL